MASVVLTGSNGGGVSQAFLLAQLADLRSPVTTLTGQVFVVSGVVDAFSAWTEIVAAAALLKDCPANCMSLVGGFRNNDGAAGGRAQIEIGIGAAGAEVVIATVSMPVNQIATQTNSESFTLVVPRQILAGNRIAFRASWSGAVAGTCFAGFNIGQVA